MLLLVPEPVWNTSMGNCRSWAPAATSAAAASTAAGTLPSRHRTSRLARRAGHLAVEHLHVAVGARRGLLDQSEAGDEGARHGKPADGKVLHRTLCLRTPQRIGRHFELPHAVAFDAERTRHALTPRTKSRSNDRMRYDNACPQAPAIPC